MLHPTKGTDMTYEEFIKHYGSEIKAAASTGFSLTTVKNWATGGIPRISQLAIQTLTEGGLLADEISFN